MKLLLIPTIALSLLLSGCATNRTVQVSAKPIERTPITLPGVDPINPRDVKWIVVTQKNVDQVFADLEKRGNNLVLFSVTDKGYEALSLNNAEMRKLVVQQQAIIGAYEAYYKRN